MVNLWTVLYYALLNLQNNYAVLNFLWLNCKAVLLCLLKKKNYNNNTNSNPQFQTQLEDLNNFIIVGNAGPIIDQTDLAQNLKIDNEPQ